MRTLPFLLIAWITGAVAQTACADALHDAFKARIEAALAVADDGARQAAMEVLFYRVGTDDWSKALAGRTAKQLASLRGTKVSFAPLPPSAETVHVLNGYEYRLNLKPVGYVVFTDPTARPGNNTKMFYSLAPGKPRYVFPSTVRRLVNAASPPDKPLQILASGMAYPGPTFNGWCEIALSNGTVKRVEVNDQKVGNQSLMMMGQSIRSCEIRNTAGRGTLSLRLYEDGRKIFERRVDSPETAIIYRAR